MGCTNRKASTFRHYPSESRMRASGCTIEEFCDAGFDAARARTISEDIHLTYHAHFGKLPPLLRLQLSIEML
jgi:hypothetical protein